MRVVSRRTVGVLVGVLGGVLADLCFAGLHLVLVINFNITSTTVKYALRVCVCSQEHEC